VSALSAYDSLANWLTTKFGKAANKIILPYQETADGSLVLPPPTPVILVGGTLAAGTLSTVVGTDNKLATTESNSSLIYSNAVSIASNSRVAVPARVVQTGSVDFGGSAAINAAARIGIATATTAGGAYPNLTLVPAVSGYYGVIKMIGVYGDLTDATTTVIFQDEDDNTLTGCPTAGFVLDITAYTRNQQLTNLIFYKGTDNKALEVDTSGYGAGANNIWFVYEYWYET
jgi:hypothetical protein